MDDILHSRGERNKTQEARRWAMTELIRYFFAVGVSVLRLRCKGWPLATLDWAATSCYACMRAATPVCSHK